jgi:nitronate monooxygenase
MAFDLRDLTVPVVGAPMAGGPSTPGLAVAVSDAGGLGFLAAGYLTPERLVEDIDAARGLGSGPLGVNLFVPQHSVGVPARLESYREALTPWAAHFGVEPGAPRADDDYWTAKLEILLDTRPQVASFTFGLPPAVVLKRLRSAGVSTLVTVTTVAEARAASAAGADVLAVQGPEAGGHRGTFNPAARPAEQPLPELLSAVAAAVQLPLVAAGGIVDAADAVALMRRGALAVQVGTALLLADEAGTNAVHRAALHDDQFVETTVTRVFSGRYARGLTNAFIWEFDAIAPLGYPEVHYMTSPIRRAAVAAGDPHGTNLWAGTRFRQAQAGPAADIVSGFVAG